MRQILSGFSKNLYIYIAVFESTRQKYQCTQHFSVLLVSGQLPAPFGVWMSARRVGQIIINGYGGGTVSLWQLIFVCRHCRSNHSIFYSIGLFTSSNLFRVSLYIYIYVYICWKGKEILTEKESMPNLFDH